ncbi:Trafficking protein particle complex II-specific subunit [Spathaspora sp. JA1]|nr:Trafficking protein particle complex II-specific subunit [Spathaspora sp. JA1]
MSDKYNFIAPAIVKIIVVPINNCPTTNFLRYLNLLKSNVNEVRLLDITPNADLQHFNPASSPNGRIFIEFTTNTIDQESVFLHDFEPFRRSFIVLGIGSYSEELNVQPHLESIKLKFPTTIVANSIIFDTPSEQITELNKLNSDVFYHDGTNNQLTALETIFCDVCGNFLNALDTFALSFANITLRSPVSITNSHVLTKAISKAQKRISLGGSTSFKFNSNTTSPTSSTATITASAGTMEKSKTHLRHLGRHRKLMGNFYLLSGKYNDALQSFIEGMTALKKCDDSLWLASALEGMAVSIILLQFIGSAYVLPSQILYPILQISKRMSMLLDPTSPRKSSLDSQNLSPRNSMQVTNGFTLSSTPDLNSIALPELLHVIMSRALYYYDLSTNDFENMVPDIVYIESILRNIKLMIGFHLSNNEVTPVNLERIIRGVKLETKGEVLDKSNILVEIDKIFQLQLVDLPIFDQCRIYSVLASMYCDLGMMRKRAFILRTLLVGLLPELEKQSTVTSQVESIKEIIDYLFVIYGINVEPEISAEDASLQSNWPFLQIQFLKLCMKIGENLNDQAFLLKLYTLLLTRYLHNLPEDDQIKLKEKIYKLHSDIPYWDPFLLRKVKFVTSKREEFIEQVPVIESVDSFYDPYQKVNTESNDRILIKDDLNYIKITLQNPFAFEIEINDLTIETEGEVKVETVKSLIKSITNRPAIKSKGIPVKSKSAGSQVTVGQPGVNFSSNNSSPTSSALTVPPNSTEQFLVGFKPLQVGQLTIIGLKISIGSCKSQFFPIIDKEIHSHSIKIAQHDPKLTNTLDKVIENLQLAAVESRATTKKLTLNVISHQPTLSLTNTSVTNGWLMLLDGEKFEFSIKLTNHSQVMINYLSFSFWDSNIEPLNNKLNSVGVNNTLDAAELYELEWALVKFKPFRIINKEEIVDKIINPGDDIEIDYEITARMGMDLSKIILDYAHKSDTPNKQKSIHIPLNISVMSAIEVVGCDILPMSVSFSESTMEDLSNYCIFIIDLKNSWNEKLNIHLRYNDQFNIDDSIEPGKTRRFLIPMNRYPLQDFKPIPSLRNRQFIKNYNLTQEAEAQLQKLFWLRQDILEKLSGTWNNGNRQGIIDLRPLRLTNKNSRNFISENISFSHTIYQDDTPVVKTGTQYCLSTDEFYTLHTTITNNSSREITGVIRHIPLPKTGKPFLSIEKKILFNGILQNKISKIPPGETLALQLSFVIIERGDYEWGTILEVLSPEVSNIIGHEPTCITAI